MAIGVDSLVLILQNTQHLSEGKGRVKTDTCVGSCLQFETHVLSVFSLGTTYTVLDVPINTLVKAQDDHAVADKPRKEIQQFFIFV